jgi:hypothetical protein
MFRSVDFFQEASNILGQCIIPCIDTLNVEEHRLVRHLIIADHLIAVGCLVCLKIQLDRMQHLQMPTVAHLTPLGGLQPVVGVLETVEMSKLHLLAAVGRLDCTVHLVCLVCLA